MLKIFCGRNSASSKYGVSCADFAESPQYTAVQILNLPLIAQLAELQPTVQQLETSGALLDPEMPMEQDDTSLLRFFAAYV